ncbi:MAG: DUF1579 family protein [Pirellulales bacterium]
MILAKRLAGMLTIRGSAVLALLCLVVSQANTIAADKANEPAAPQQALERFVGEWETNATIRRAGPPPREIVTHGKATCRRTLGGEWFEFRTQTIPAGESDLQVMTYDAAAGVYRQWVFSSDGYRHEATGQWNDATSTLRWSGRSGDNTFVIDDQWATPDRLEWTLRRKNAQGDIVQTIAGIVTRAEEQ